MSPCSLIQLECPFEVRLRIVGAPGGACGLTRALVQRSLGERLPGELCGALEVVLGFVVRSERRRALAGACEHLLRLGPDLGRIVRIGRQPIGVEVVRRDHLDDLLLSRAEGLYEMGGGCEVASLPLTFGQRVVRDPLEQILKEAVLAELGRARVGLNRKDLLAHERGEERVELSLVQAGQRPQAGLRERLAEHGGVLEQPPLVRLETVEPRRDQGVERLGDVERLDRSGRPVHVSFAGQKAAVEQHAYRLDRVERYAFRPIEDLRAKLAGQARDEPVEQRLHRRLRERLQRERRRVPAARAEAGPPLGEVGPRQREHEQWMAA